MSFFRTVEKIQESKEAEGKIVIVRCGAFFVSIGKDAVILSTLLGLNVNCFKLRICKVGMPVNHMMKYIEELEKIGHSFLVYDYEKERKKYILKYSFEGKSVEENAKCFDCEKCEYYKTNARYREMDIFELLSKKQEGKYDE